MSNKLLFLYFDFLRYFNDGVPSEKECYWASTKTIRLSPNAKIAVFAYANGRSLEEIAEAQNVTRERIRQYLMKACRTARIMV